MILLMLLIQVNNDDILGKLAGSALPLGVVSKAPKGNGIGATGSKNWVWF